MHPDAGDADVDQDAATSSSSPLWCGESLVEYSKDSRTSTFEEGRRKD